LDKLDPETVPAAVVSPQLPHRHGRVEAPDMLDVHRIVKGQVQAGANTDLQHAAPGQRHHLAALPGDRLLTAEEMHHSRQDVFAVISHQFDTANPVGFEISVTYIATGRHPLSSRATSFADFTA